MRTTWIASCLCGWIVLLAVLTAHAQRAATSSSSNRSTTTTTPIGATTQESGPHGPDTVVLSELVKLYEPVPFDHKSHAQMAEMWDGCTTCHHRPPTTQAASNPATAEAMAAYLDHHDQNQAGKIPACKFCHSPTLEPVSIDMPALKGAYHRQCLNCHREWANANSCTACHKPLDPDAPIAAATTAPSADDIVGRMHPPMPEPDVKIYKTRFTPAVGTNAIFRHKEHVEKYGLKCVNCHRHDNCSSCHNSKAEATGSHLLKPGRTWRDTHGPCVGCHENDRCKTCHYDDNAAPPPPFTHAMTRMILDKDHASLKCSQCHVLIKAKTQVTCGDSSCHKQQAMAYPRQMPGKLLATTQPAGPTPSTKPIVETQTEPGGIVIKRVRAAGNGGVE